MSLGRRNGSLRRRGQIRRRDTCSEPGRLNPSHVGDVAKELLEHHRTHARVLAQCAPQLGVDALARGCLLVLGEHLLGRPSEQRTAAHHPLHERRHVVDQRALVDDLPLDLLGGDGHQRPRASGLRFSDREASHPNALGAREDDIGTEVAMNHADTLRLKQGFTDLYRQRRSVFGRQRTGLQMLGQRLLRANVRDLEDTVAVFASMDDAEDPGRENALELPKLTEASLEREARGKTGAVVDRDPHGRCLSVGRSVGRCTRACSHERVERVRTIDHCARRKLRFTHRVCSAQLRPRRQVEQLQRTAAPGGRSRRRGVQGGVTGPGAGRTFSQGASPRHDNAGDKRTRHPHGYRRRFANPRRSSAARSSLAGKPRPRLALWEPARPAHRSPRTARRRRACCSEPSWPSEHGRPSAGGWRVCVWRLA